MSHNILHINFSDQGGAAIASMDLHEELLKQGINSNYLVLNLTKKYPVEKQYYYHRRIYKSIIEKAWYLYIKAKWIEWKNIRILSQIKKPNDVISTPYSCFDITKDPLYKKADIIHLHWTARFLDWPSFFKKNKKPVVWSLHDRIPFSGILHCKTDFPVNAQKIESAFVQKKKEWVKNSNITIISPSSTYKTASLKSNILNEFNHNVVYHGIPQNIFYPLSKIETRRKNNLMTDKRIVISVASDVKRKLKGFEEITDTAKKMTDIIFIFIGAKDNDNHTLPNLIYTGSIKNRSSLNEWYNCADVTISNSKEESFGLSIAESLKTGTPVIMRKTGLHEDIINTDNGIVFEGKLMDAIKDFYSKSYSKEKIIKSVNESLDIKRCAKEHLLIYEKI